MAFATLNNAQTAWWLANRPGHLPNGTPGTALVSDLLVDDYLAGARMRVVSTGSTVSGVRTLTVERAGLQATVNWVAASTVIILRP